MMRTGFLGASIWSDLKVEGAAVARKGEWKGLSGYYKTKAKCAGAWAVQHFATEKRMFDERAPQEVPSRMHQK
jgi:hypothetical protein